jgi:Uma2 family endonuclease
VARAACSIDEATSVRSLGSFWRDVVLVVEIVSPGSRGTDHVMKLHEYAKAGIEKYWIVDPDAPPDDRFLAYRLDGESYRRVTALDGDMVRVNEPTKMEFALDQLTGR